MADPKIKHDWRAAAAAPPGADSRSKAPLFVMMLLAAALGGAIVGLWFWLGGDSGPRFISLPLADLNNPVWPPVPYAEDDGKRIAAHFNERNREVAFTSREEELYARKLDSLKQINNRSLVLHVSGLAVARDDKVYLLGLLAAPGVVNGSWHPIDELFEAVRKCPASEKLLILDVARPVADANSGVLADRASALLQSQLEKLKDDSQLGLVLVSAAGGEFSQVLDEERGTAFAYFIDQGLAGDADGILDGTRDGRVRVKELAAYVKDRVSRWSHFARGAVQTPYLVGNGDFRVVALQWRYGLEFTAYKAPAYPKSLLDAWTMRDTWIAEGAPVLAPHLLPNLERRLIRGEARFAAGVPEDKIASEVAFDRNDLEPAWQKLRAVTPPSTFSFVGVRRPVGLSDRMEGWLETKAPDGKLESGKLREPSKGEPFKATPAELLAVIWDKFRDVSLKREQVIALVTEGLGPAGKVEQSEVALMAITRQLAEQQIFTSGARAWPGETILAACQAEQQIREALAATPPEGFRWFKSRLADIAAQRSAAETKLLSLGDDRLDRARTEAERATAQFKDTAKAATDLRDDARIASAAFQNLAESMAELPGFAPLLIRLERSRAGDGLETWTAANEAAATIAEAFEKDATFPRELLQSQSARLREAMGRLRGLVVRLQEGEPRFETVSALSASPRMKAPDRAKYWKLWRDTSAGKYNWLHENDTKSLAASPGPPGFDALGEASRAARRARVALDLCRLGGMPTGTLETDFLPLKDSRDPAAWDSFGSQLVPLLSPSPQAGPITPRVSRLFGTSDASSREAARLRAEFWTWLELQYHNEGTARGEIVAPFYRKATQDCREAASRARKAESER